MNSHQKTQEYIKLIIFTQKLFPIIYVQKFLEISA